MSRFNTGNPIGSADPRDRDDNSKNLDEAVNSNSSSFTDRLGQLRPTLRGAIDPSGLASSAAASAQQATNQASRAETARDAATVNAQVYDTIASGLAATSNGGQFQVVSGLEIVRYRRIDSENAVEVARYPSSEFAGIGISMASEPRASSSDFFSAPSQNIPALAFTDSEGNTVFSVDGDGTVRQPWQGEFYTEPVGGFAYAWTDRNGKVFYAVDDNGQSIVGGGLDPSLLANRTTAADPGAAYNNYGAIRIKPENSFFRDDPRTVLSVHQDLYGLYDDLVSQFPDYVSMSIAGHDALNNEIREYRFTPPDYWRGLNPPAQELTGKPKFLLFCAVHGNEKRAAAGVYYLMSDLCRRWRQDNRLSALRWGVDYVVVPVANPSGFDETNRLNHNGVDVNRNFTFGWDESTSEVKGSAPLSELEAQVATAIMASHSDATYVIDNHNAGSLNNASTPYAYWVGMESPLILEPVRRTLDYMTGFLRKEFDGFGDEGDRVTRLTGTPETTLAREAEEVHGSIGVLLETGSGWDDIHDLEKHTYEAVVNMNHALYEHSILLKTLRNMG